MKTLLQKEKLVILSNFSLFHIVFKCRLLQWHQKGSISGKVQLLKRDENIGAKGEIAHYEQFLLLPQYFQKSSAAMAPYVVCIRERGEYPIKLYCHNYGTDWSVSTDLVMYSSCDSSLYTAYT